MLAHDMALKIERFACPGKGNGLRAVHKVRAGELLFKASSVLITRGARSLRFDPNLWPHIPSPCISELVGEITHFHLSK